MPFALLKSIQLPLALLDDKSIKEYWLVYVLMLTDVVVGEFVSEISVTLLPKTLTDVLALNSALAITVPPLSILNLSVIPLEFPVPKARCKAPPPPASIATIFAAVKVFSPKLIPPP